MRRSIKWLADREMKIVKRTAINPTSTLETETVILPKVNG